MLIVLLPVKDKTTPGVVKMPVPIYQFLWIQHSCRNIHRTKTLINPTILFMINAATSHVLRLRVTTVNSDLVSSSFCAFSVKSLIWEIELDRLYTSVWPLGVLMFLKESAVWLPDGEVSYNSIEVELTWISGLCDQFCIDKLAFRLILLLSHLLLKLR